MSLTLQLPSHEEQTELNLQRWEELVNDSELAQQLAKIEGRIETDRYGNILMTPPPGLLHSGRQSEIAYLLRILLPEGRVFTECPVSTSDGVRGADVVWISRSRWEKQPRQDLCFTEAPEICVEVLSPSNKRQEIIEKRALYFAAGAEEVWICTRQGKMEFYHRGEENPRAASTLCPDFPQVIETP